MAPKRKEPEGDSPEERDRQEKRRQQNREAAQRCRDKKKEKGENIKKVRTSYGFCLEYV